VIDRNGRPLFPHIISATHEDFGWAAATGILRWRYQPPVKNGEKVDARVKVTVVFDIKKSADMW
jgi:acyl dehydratase